MADAHPQQTVEQTEVAIVGVSPSTPRHYTVAEWEEHCRRRNVVNAREAGERFERAIAAKNARKAEKAAKKRATKARKRATTRKSREALSPQHRRACWVFLVERAVEVLPDEAVWNKDLAQRILKGWPEWAAVMECLPRPGRQIIALAEGVTEAVRERREMSPLLPEQPPIVANPYGPGPAQPHIWPMTPRYIPRAGCRWVGARRFLSEWENCVDWGTAPDDGDWEDSLY